MITDAPVVYKQDTTLDINNESEDTQLQDIENPDEEEDVATWKPKNYSTKFSGDILLRNALKRSQNIPTIKIMQDLGVTWISDYAKRLGLFSNLNMDLSMGLGSSSVTLYEMTKTFSHFANLGKRFSPVLVREIIEKQEVIGTDIMVDLRFEDKTYPIEEEFESRRISLLEEQNENNEQNADNSKNINPNEPNIFFEDPDQLILSSDCIRNHQPA